MDATGRVTCMQEVTNPEQVSERYWTKVDRSAGPDACWPWNSSLTRRGYGLFSMRGPQGSQHYLAHRVAFLLEFGHMPPESAPFLMHTCDNPRCVNPRHLRPGTHQDNMTDMASKGRKRGYGGGTGVRNGRSRLTAKAVLELRMWRDQRGIQTMYARTFQVSVSTVSLAMNGRTWSHLPMPGQIGWGDALRRHGLQHEAKRPD